MIQLFQSSLPASFHQNLVGELDALAGGEIGHELAFMFPSVHDLLEDSAVLDAVSEMLGPGAIPDGCMHLHLNSRPENGPWHPDDYCGKPWPRPMAILCYFPQETPLDMGPTEAKYDGGSVLAAGPAGTCLLMRNDVEHRATANTSDRRRYMLKFLWAALR